MNEKGTNTVVESTKDAFSLVVLLGRIRTGEAKESVVGCEERTICEVVKFFAVVGLKCEYG